MKLPPRKYFSTTLRILCVLVLLFTPVFSTLWTQRAYADGLTDRSLTLQPGSGSDGGSLAGGTVDYFFQFNLPNTGGGNVGSIRIEFCDRAGPDGSYPNCTAPNDGSGPPPVAIDTSGATVDDTPGGNQVSGWASSPTVLQTDPVNTGANNGVLLTRTPAAVTAGSDVKFALRGVINPPVKNTTFFAWIKSYASGDGSGSPVDTGTVAASTADAITLSGHMPESLSFCTGATVSTNGGSPDIPDCSSATSGSINFDILFDPLDTATATSQMAASTNATNGYSITVQGATLTNGANTINTMGTTGPDTPAAIAVGTRQFGLNLVKNSTTLTHDTDGTCPDGTTDNPCKLGWSLQTGFDGAAVYNGLVSSPFATTDQFFFDASKANVVATSNSLGSDAEIYTVSYVANVNASLPAGDYTTTLTYVCTGQF